MSEERKTKADAAAPASAALGRIDRKDAFLQALHTFLTAHQGTEWAVAAVDIQHFKLYNELYGTEKGDALLETVANCLLGYSRQTGYPVGYFGNDDFFLCLPDEKAEQTAVLATLQACMAAGRQDVTFFMVMGVCPVQANPGADAATLCNYAQIAGVTTDSGYLHRFEPTMLNELKEQQQLLGELERALDNHEFCFFLQPKCNSITRAIVGMEALVRWNHPTRGCVPPAEFMPLLERTGLVTRLDQYIWESVCQTLQKWQESGSNLVPVSVNVSVQDILNLDVPQIFADLVEKYKLEPKLLLAEITETMVAEDTQMVESAIQGLHRKGFAVMMDDFGSGYSSLNMLKDTNVDAIKLDMKLIDMNQENRSKGVQIVESVVDMAHRLNLPIIAEGVETPEQVSMLQAADCLYSQGYYFFKPMPVENAEKLLADPTNQDYWDLRRDLMRRDRRVENPGTEKTALALQAYQIFTDNVLEISLLNLATGAYRVIKRDARLLDPDLEKEEDFVNYCDRMVNEKIVHEEDTDLFLEQTDLEALRSVLYHATAPEFYRYRENVSGQYIWVTTEVLPCRGCCAQNPWATVLVRNDAQADQLSEELDFSYSHDTLTGLANRSRYEADLRELPNSGYESVVCTYIDVVGMHEVNEHLGHRSGDTLLCCLANAARKFFATSRVYRIGSDEFVILTPNEPPYSVWSTADARLFEGKGLCYFRRHPADRRPAPSGRSCGQGRGCHAAGPAGLLRPQRPRPPAGRPERKDGAHPAGKAGCRALFKGACPQIQDSDRGGLAGGHRAPRYCAGRLPVRSGHLRRLFPRCVDQLPRQAGSARGQRKLCKVVRFRPCAQHRVQQQPAGASLPQDGWPQLLHPCDPLLPQRLPHQRGAVDLRG